MSQNHNNPIDALFALLGNFAEPANDSPETILASALTRDFLNQVAPEEVLFTLELPGIEFLAGDWHGTTGKGAFEDFMGQLAAEKALAESLYLNRPAGGLNLESARVGDILRNVDEILANLDRENARLEAEREACKLRHPSGKGAAKNFVHVGDAKVSMTTDERGTKRVTVEEPLVTMCKNPERSEGVSVDPLGLDTLSVFAESVLASLFASAFPVEEETSKTILLPHVGEVLFEDNSDLDSSENLGLMIEDRNKGVFMFDENTSDPEGNVSYAWFAWGDTKPSYPSFPAKVIRVP